MALALYTMWESGVTPPVQYICFREKNTSNMIKNNLNSRTRRITFDSDVVYFEKIAELHLQNFLGKCPPGI